LVESGRGFHAGKWAKAHALARGTIRTAASSREEAACRQ
jgi:hypothetical protein